MEEITETAIETPSEPKRESMSTKQLAKYLTIAIIAITVGCLHYQYVSQLFENDRAFSYLSEMEREMSLRTEMGFYYSYYKTIVQERPFMAGISKLMYDRLVEHPQEVNAFNRFNIHPEVIIGALYRYFEPVLNTTKHRQCHMVDRGVGMTPVESCVGLGEPIMFYLEAVWVLAGFTTAVLFLHAAALSETLFGGVIAVIQYFTNHVECTRVQWAPNERENMAAPLLLLQAWLVSLQLRNRGGRHAFQLQEQVWSVEHIYSDMNAYFAFPLVFIVSWTALTAEVFGVARHMINVSIFITNCLCLLFWQFTQFIFLTQTAIFFVMEQLRIIDVKSLCVLLHSHFCGLHMAVLLLQGNDMLKSSLYASFFIMVSMYCLFFSSLRVKVQNRVDLLVESWLVLLRIAIVLCCSFYLKKIISDFLEVEEDSHIWDILYSKFTDYKTFHTLLYTCSEVFDFLPLSSVKKLCLSMLIPFASVAVINFCIFTAKKAWETKSTDKKLEKDSDDEDSGIEDAIKRNRINTIDKREEEECQDGVVRFLSKLAVEPAVFYNVSQMVVYGVMAGMVMRLKMLFVPQMCAVSALFFNKNYYSLPKSCTKYLPVVWIVSLVPVFYHLHKNVAKEMSHTGEFSDIHQEKLFHWILSESSLTSAFAGSMPLLASVMLVTRRPVVAHPHYEHKQARQRAYSMYKMYGRFSAEEVYQDLKKLKVSYLIVETKYCYGKSSKGCSFADMWDIEAPAHASQPLLCDRLLRSRVEHFYEMYKDEHYAVYRLHDYSVSYMPRSFDT